MNNILIIHLKRFGDLVSAIKSQHPHSNISLLCFEEFSSVTKLIPSLKNVYTINRNSLNTLTKGQLYNTGFAIEELRAKLVSVAKENWDRVINITNDRASAHLCSWLLAQNSKSKIKGIRVDDNNLVVASDFWSLTYNDVLTKTVNNSPLNFRDVWSRMTGVEELEPAKLLTNARNEETVSRNFDTIRKTKGSVVGIQVHCSVKDKGFTDEFVVELCDQYSAKNISPVLLIAPNKEERSRSRNIAEACLTKPIVIECDFIALSSVVKNLDLVVTPDTVTKHFADAQNTPCLEISLGSSPVFKQATMNPNSLLVVSNCRTLRSVNIPFVLEATAALLTNNRNARFTSPQANVYSPRRLNGQTVYVTKTSTSNDEVELERHSQTLLLNRIANINNTNSDDITSIAIESVNNPVTAKAWANKTSDAISNQTREVLHAIRSLLQVKENPKKVSSFVEALDRVLNVTDTLTTASLSSIIFRSKLESLPPANFNENARVIESLLFELKANLQTSQSLVQNWEMAFNSIRSDSKRSRSDVTTDLR